MWSITFTITMLGITLCSGSPRVPKIQLSRDAMGVEWRTPYELARVEAYGTDSIRVRFTNSRGPITDVALGAILTNPELRAGARATETIHVKLHDPPVRGVAAAGGNVTNGCIVAVVILDSNCCSQQTGSNMKISFYSTITQELLTEEFYPHHGVGSRAMMPYARGSGGLFSVEYSLATQWDERFYGLGQHSHGMLDQRGTVIDFDQFNTEVNRIMLFSSKSGR